MTKVQLKALLRCTAALFTFAFVAPALAKDSENYRTETETEIRITLSESAFEKIHSTLNLEEPAKTRIDTYFDIATDGVFLRKRNVPQAKQRIQQKSRELTLQKSWMINQQIVNELGFTYTVSKKISSKKDFNTKQSTSNKLQQSHFILHAALTQQTISLDQKRFLQKLWSTIKWPVLKELDDATEHIPGNLVPAAVVTKTRWKVTTQTAKGEKFKIQLGSDSNTLGPKTRTFYELESELTDTSPEDLLSRANAISSFLAECGVHPNETSELSDHDFYDDLEKTYPKK